MLGVARRNSPQCGQKQSLNEKEVSSLGEIGRAVAWQGKVIDNQR